MKYDNNKIIELYKKGLTLRQVAEKIGCTLGWAHTVVKKYAPKLMRKPYYNYRNKK